MSNLAVAARAVFGPNLEAEHSITLLEVAGAEHLGRAMDAGWRRRWRTLVQSLGVSLPRDEPADPVAATALAAEAIAAGALGRAARPVRPGRRAGTHVLSEMPLAIATRAAQIALATVDLSRATLPPPAATARMRSTLRALGAATANLPGQKHEKSAAALADAAARLGVPWRWSTTCAGALAIGEGRRQTLFNGSCPLSAPVLGSHISTHKLASKRYLEAFHLPTVPDRLVARPDAAAAAAVALGFPVVVKPVDGSLGRGISLDVRTEEGVRIAAERALAHGTAVMVEPYLDLPDFRAFVVGRELSMVFRRNPPYVTGDGASTVAALLAEHNRAVAEHRQAFGSRYPVTADDDVHRTLGNAGLTLDSVPEAGRRVILRTNPLRAFGGYPVDVTADTHPSIADLLRRLMALVRLPMAAIDFRAEAIDRPWDEQRFAFLEFNVRPDVSSYPGHPMLDAIVRLAAPVGESVRLPTLLVVDPDPGEGPALLRAAIAAAGLAAAVAGPDGLRLGGVRVPDDGGPDHARMVEDPTLDVAIHWTTPERLARSGLGADVIDQAWFAGGGEDGDGPALRALVQSRARTFATLPDGSLAERAAVVLAAAERLAGGMPSS